MSGIGVPANDPMVVPHSDGIGRCRWAAETNPDLVDYHDRQWGTPVHDETGLLEALAMTYFENGLSFAVVFGKREAFRRAFRGFEPAEVATFTGREIDALMLDRTIVRNRAKIEATVHNARVMQSVSLNELVWRHRPRRHRLRERGATRQSAQPGVARVCENPSRGRISARRAGGGSFLHAGRRRRERTFRRLLSRPASWLNAIRCIVLSLAVRLGQLDRALAGILELARRVRGDHRGLEAHHVDLGHTGLVEPVSAQVG